MGKRKPRSTPEVRSAASRDAEAGAAPPPAWKQWLLAPRGEVGARAPGRHVSVRLGAGGPFFDYRGYAPGEDASAVDWKLYGRTDRLMVRRLQQEARLDLVLLLDRSASMDFPRRRGAVTKWEASLQLAALLARLALGQGDRVGVSTAGTSLEPRLAPRGGPGGAAALAAALDGVGPTARSEAGLAGAVHALPGVVPPRAMVVVLSDLLEPSGPMLDAMASLRQARCEAAVFSVLSPEERLGPDPGAGVLRLIEPETGSEGARVSGDAWRADYQRAIRGHEDRLHRGLATLGVELERVSTESSPPRLLGEWLRRRARRSSRRG